MTPSILVEVADPSHAGEARRRAVGPAGDAALSPGRASDLAIVVTELATNLVKHAGGGALAIQAGPRGGVEVLSIDRGGGIADIRRSLEDGYSTAGSPGTGLGAIGRLASEFEIYSQPGKGTVLRALVAERERQRPSSSRLRTGALSVAVRGESVCGDLYTIREHPDGFTVMLADGLGHGPIAAEAAAAAARIFAARNPANVEDVLLAIHDGLRSTRGAAVALACVNLARGVVSYTGLGNIVGAVVSGAAVRRMVSHNGTAGQAQPRVSVFSYPWERDSTLLMHSDGLQTRWDLDQYPGLMVKHPGVWAGVLWRDFARGRDDATVVVVRGAAP